jgi:hypothetical protein
MAGLHRIGRYFETRPLLVLLLLIDTIFIALHVWLWSEGRLSPRFSIAHDDGLPEAFNYLKWLVSALVCVYAFDLRRKPLYFVWAVLFVYFLVDDSYSIHERVGGSLTTAFGFEPALALRAQDFGELTVSMIAGVVLLGAMALAYRKSDDAAARAFTLLLLPWLGLLIFCGVFVDMLHIQVGKLFHWHCQSKSA